MKQLKSTRKFFSQVLLLSILTGTAAHATVQFLTISDIHYGAGNSSADGHDTGPDFLKITLAKMQKLSKNADFIIYLGDLPQHLLFSRAKKARYEEVVFSGLYQNDVDKKPLFYVTGNNDSFESNYGAFKIGKWSPLVFAKDWHGACAHCDGLIIDKQHMDDGGYYASYVMPHNKQIILFALNATQWTKTPFFAKYHNQKQDALIQLAWLENQLKTHHAKQLLIALHEPPGKSHHGQPIWQPYYLALFINLLAKYASHYGEITLIVSHTHMDEIRKIKINAEKTIYAFSTPGISRNHHNYPGMKLFSLNSHLKVKNFTTYYTSQRHNWQQEHYTALGHKNAIFSHCTRSNLAQCLNRLTTEQVCQSLEQGAFWGVKSPYVRHTTCRISYAIN